MAADTLTEDTTTGSQEPSGPAQPAPKRRNSRSNPAKATKRKYIRRAPLKAAQADSSLKAPLGLDSAPQIDKSLASINRVDLSKAIKLILVKGVPQADVARAMGVSHQAINQAVKPFKALLDAPLPTQAYNDRKEDILDAAMSKLLVHSVAPEKIKKASTYQLVGSFGLLFDKQRLIRGESTSNFDIRSQSVYLGREIERIKQELSDLPGESDASD